MSEIKINLSPAGEIKRQRILKWQETGKIEDLLSPEENILRSLRARYKMAIRAGETREANQLKTEIIQFKQQIEV